MRWFLAVLLFLLPLPAWAGIVLDGTTDALELITSSDAAIDYDCSWTDNTSTTFAASRSHGQISSATTTTIVAAPAASTQRDIIECSFRNTSATTANTLTLQRDVSATNRTKYTATLQPGDSWRYSAQTSWTLQSASGLVKERAEDTSFTSTNLAFQKVGNTSEAVGVRFYYAANIGDPPGWSPGTPGLNGAATDCSSTSGAATVGTRYLQNPAVGGWYLTQGAFSTTVAHFIELIDVLWYNTGIVVTTTTNQNITFPGLPSRDAFGATNGNGVQAALYVSVATTNAGATNPSINYTDQDGNTGATATIASFPATAAAGTFAPFNIANGDTGIRSVQSITLNTSLVTGTVHLVLYRVLATFPATIANIGSNLSPTAIHARLWNGTCLWLGYIASATTSTNISGSVTVEEK